MRIDGCRTRLHLVAVIVFAATWFASPAEAAAPAPPPLTSDEVVARMIAMDAERAAKDRGYRGTRHYTIDYKGFPGDKHAEMVVQVVSNPPNKEFTIISETGSNLLLNRVLHKLIEGELEANGGKNQREVKLTPENYSFGLVGIEDVEGIPCYALQVKPKRDNKFLYRGKVWIDAQDFAVVQISAKPAKNPSFWISSVQIEQRYEKRGDLWLPRTNQSTSKVRFFGGRAELTVDYQEYELAASALR